MKCAQGVLLLFPCLNLIASACSTRHGNSDSAPDSATEAAQIGGQTDLVLEREPSFDAFTLTFCGALNVAPPSVEAQRYK